MKCSTTVLSTSIIVDTYAMDALFGGFMHALGPRLSTQTHEWINNRIWSGFIVGQIMVEHKQIVFQNAKDGLAPTRDTFIMASDVHNLV